MTILHYITEIKNRTIVITWTILSNFIILLIHKEELTYLLAKYQENIIPYFITTNLPEIFLSMLKISIFLSIYSSYSIILLQICIFFLPGLYKNEYVTIKNLIILSLILYICCTTITYIIFLPYCWDFFTSFELKTEETIIGIYLEARLNDYLDFYIKVLLSLTVLFQGIIILLIFIHNIRRSELTKNRKMFYLIFFTIATIFSPPDIYSQVFIALALTAFFEFFLLSIHITDAYKGE